MRLEESNEPNPDREDGKSKKLPFHQEFLGKATLPSCDFANVYSQTVTNLEITEI